jgi:CHAT domain-containing protein/tetratricopeptide (TPR) repeat protein
MMILTLLAVWAQGAGESERLTREMVRLYNAGKYAEAVPLAQRAVAIRERSLGPNHPSTADSLSNLALLYKSLGAYSKAEPLFVRALEIRERALGPTHPDLSTMLNNLALLYYSQGAYQKAEPLFVRSLALSEKKPGPNHPDTAASLNNLALLYSAEGVYDKAEPLYVRALAICEKALGSDDPRTVTSLENLAELYKARGAYPKAEPLLVRTLAIREQTQGQSHPATAGSLNNLADLYRLEGAYQKAEPLYVKALAIHERLGPDLPETAATLNSLAVVYHDQGLLKRAEPLYIRALSIREKVLGPNHPATATSLNNLADFYRSQGLFQKAEPFFVRALTIREKALGPDHPDTATSLNNLAELYRTERAYRKAEPLYLRSLAIRERSLGANHPDTANSLNNLATSYLSQGAYEKAEPLYRRALAIRENTLPTGHPDIAASLNNLAELYEAQGAHQRAEPLYVRALEINERKLGPNHPATATALNNLAVLYQLEGAYQRAMSLFGRASAIQENVLGPEHPETLRTRTNILLMQCAYGDWKTAMAGFALVIGSRRYQQDLAFGRDSEKRGVLDRRERLLSALHAGASLGPYRGAYLPLLLRTVLASKGRLTDEMTAAIEAIKLRAGAEDRKLLTDWQETGARLSFLTQRGPGNALPADFRKEVADLQSGEDDLAAKIAARSADFRNLSAEPALEKITTFLRGRVLVEILRVRQFHPPGKSDLYGELLYTAIALFPDGRIEMVDLGNSNDIDPLVTAYRQAQQATDNLDTVDAVAQKIGRVIVDPIAKMTGSALEWYVASDGELRLIPLSALRLVNGKYVAGTYKIWPIGSGRDLLGLGSGIKLGHDVILANPDFGAGEGGFVNLPETEDEADAIAAKLPGARVVPVADRTKKYLLNLQTPPRILHLATHAFYRPGTGDATLRSGIALNGANVGPEGVLTAKEAQSLPILGTQLVVLSACDTGIGETSFADGLVGLQRSLILAGAKSQMVTLWPVNSAHTLDFMRRFYEKLAARRTKGDAWLDTQHDLIREGVPAHFWAPFVLFGDPGPLEEK